jgi:Beta-lactamase
MRLACWLRQRLLEGLALFVCPIALCVAEPATAAKQRESVSLPQVDAIVQQAIDTHQIPGAVVLVGHNGRVIYRKAFGWRSLEPRRELMTMDTIFDIASLTKVVVATTHTRQPGSRSNSLSSLAYGYGPAPQINSQLARKSAVRNRVKASPRTGE